MYRANVLQPPARRLLLIVAHVPIIAGSSRTTSAEERPTCPACGTRARFALVSLAGFK